ncbi:MAG: outer membrane protein assembly factor BamB family protein [Gammaproteobacteria bacterium]|jgi:PQQ-dependent dehydrogenase (methanol/ethanol family)
MHKFIQNSTPILIMMLSIASQAQMESFEPVTDETLLNPDSGDWLMYSRTYDNQRFSPLDQINRNNIDQLQMVWSHEMHEGTQENIPLVYNGVMFVANPRSVIQAVDAKSGELIWEYKRELPADIDDHQNAVGRARTLAIYHDMIYHSAADGYVIALDAKTGTLRWETFAHDYKTNTQHTTGPSVVKGKVITGRNCGDTRKYCYILAHDALTGKEVWRFFVPAGSNEPGGDTWGSMDDDLRLASPWGLPGSFDPKRNLIYWGTANPSPHTRIKRHNGKPFDVSLSTPSELYSNSTLALNPDTGELVWYYQHLPGDDWDSDHTHERILFSSTFNPDPNQVKWINPSIARGQTRDMVVSVGEPGGLWVLDRNDGTFLWTIPFPYDTPDFHIADIDAETGQTFISRDKVLTREGEEHTTCFQNTKGYWPMAYHPGNNSLYVPYHDICVSRIGRLNTANGHARTTHLRDGADPDAFAGLAKVDMSTGEVVHMHTQRAPGNGAILLTAGDLVIWGDITGTLHAFDADNGEILWDTMVPGIIQTSTITYMVDGKQYIAILTGDGLSATSSVVGLVSDVKAVRGHNAIYVFALPD